MKLTNIVLWVQENKLSEKFYKKLGFEIVRSDDERTTLRLHGFGIELVSMRDEGLFAVDAMAPDKGRGVYIYLRVDTIDETYDKLLSQGFRPATKPTDWDWGNREFILKDPDGYKLCFWQPNE